MKEQDQFPALAAKAVDPAKPLNAFNLDYRVPFAPKAERASTFKSKKPPMTAQERTEKVLAARWLSPYCRPGRI